MKTIKLLILITTLVIGTVLLTGCDQQATDHEFVIPKSDPAVALTIGWYVPVTSLAELAKPYKPRIVKDDTLSMLMIFIVKSEEHMLDGKDLGEMEAAHLVIPVEVPDGMKNAVDGAVVCPINIVDQSQQLGDKYNNNRFATYFGDIDLEVKKSDKDGNWYAEASIKTNNGIIEINGMFDQEAEANDVVTAMFTHKPGPRTYFYGAERMKRIKDGKGNLKQGGKKHDQRAGCFRSSLFFKT